MRVNLLELELVRGNDLARRVKDQEASAGRALINGTDKAKM